MSPTSRRPEFVGSFGHHDLVSNSESVPPSRDYFEAFFDDVGEGSTFEVILRGHLWVEAELVKSLEATMPFPTRARLDRLTFLQKVALAAGHGLVRHDDVPAFNKLNALRNRLAHNLGTGITPADEADLKSCAGKHLLGLVDGLEGRAGKDGWTLRFMITAMCISLQIDRERLEEANSRLRAAAQRVRVHRGS